MPVKTLQKAAILTVLVMLLPGCATRKSLSLQTLPVDAPSHWNVLDYQFFSSQLFSAHAKAEMQSYIAEVLRNNPDLKSIAATARAVSHAADAAQAERWPYADLNLAGQRNRDALSKETGNRASVSVDINWDLDPKIRS